MKKCEHKWQHESRDKGKQLWATCKVRGYSRPTRIISIEPYQKEQTPARGKESFKSTKKFE